jgi:hypothetical protein
MHSQNQSLSGSVLDFCLYNKESELNNAVSNLLMFASIMTTLPTRFIVHSMGLTTGIIIKGFVCHLLVFTGIVINPSRDSRYSVVNVNYG